MSEQTSHATFPRSGPSTSPTSSARLGPRPYGREMITSSGPTRTADAGPNRGPRSWRHLEQTQIRVATLTQQLAGLAGAIEEAKTEIESLDELPRPGGRSDHELRTLIDLVAAAFPGAWAPADSDVLMIDRQRDRVEVRRLPQTSPVRPTVLRE